MNLPEKSPAYDYLVIDSKGTRKVINGVEYPATEDDLPKEHRDSGCKECSFVQDKNTLLLYVVSRELREKAGEKPYCIGKFNMPGWTGHSNFYLFACVECGAITVDYPHGYTSDGMRCGLLYLRCDNCDRRLVVYDKEIYGGEGMKSPPTLIEMLMRLPKLFWGTRKRQL